MRRDRCVVLTRTLVFDDDSLRRNNNSSSTGSRRALRSEARTSSAKEKQGMQRHWSSLLPAGEAVDLCSSERHKDCRRAGHGKKTLRHKRVKECSESHQGSLGL